MKYVSVNLCYVKERVKWIEYRWPSEPMSERVPSWYGNRLVESVQINSFTSARVQECSRHRRKERQGDHESKLIDRPTFTCGDAYDLSDLQSNNKYASTSSSSSSLSRVSVNRAVYPLLQAPLKESISSVHREKQVFPLINDPDTRKDEKGHNFEQRLSDARVCNRINSSNLAAGALQSTRNSVSHCRDEDARVNSIVSSSSSSTSPYRIVHRETSERTVCTSADRVHTSLSGSSNNARVNLQSHLPGSSSRSVNSGLPRVHSSIASSTQLIVQAPSNSIPVSVEIHTSPSPVAGDRSRRVTCRTLNGVSSTFSSFPLNNSPFHRHHGHHHTPHWSMRHARKKLRLGHPSNSGKREMTVFAIYKPQAASSGGTVSGGRVPSSTSCPDRHANSINHVHIVNSTSKYVDEARAIKVEEARESIISESEYHQPYYTMNHSTGSNNTLSSKASSTAASTATSIFHQVSHSRYSHSQGHCSGSNQLSLPGWNNPASSSSREASLSELTASNCNLETIAEETANLSPVSKEFSSRLPPVVTARSPVTITVTSTPVPSATSRARLAVSSLFPCVQHSSSWNSLGASTTTDSIVTTKNTKIAGKSFSHNSLIAGANDTAAVTAPGPTSTAAAATVVMSDDDEDAVQSTSIDLPMASSNNTSLSNLNVLPGVNTLHNSTGQLQKQHTLASSTSAIVTIHANNQANQQQQQQQAQRTRRKSSILSVDKLFKNKIIATTTNTARTSIASRLSIASDQDLRVTNFNRLTDLRKMLNEEDEKDDLMTIFWYKFNTCDWFEWNLNNAAKLVTIGVFVVTFTLITRAVINLNWHR